MCIHIYKYIYIFIGFDLVNSMKTPLPSPPPFLPPFLPPSYRPLSPQKEPFTLFWSKMTRNVLNRVKNQFSDICDFYFLRCVLTICKKNASQKMCNVRERIFEFISCFFLCDF